MSKNTTSSPLSCPPSCQEQELKTHKQATAYLNKLCLSPLVADQRFYRLYRAAECNTPQELAAFLGITPSTLAKAKKSGKIPSDWLLTILCVKNIFPQWILTGKGPLYAENSLEDTKGDEFESSHAFHERQEDRAALQRLSSYTLTQELLRRIALRGNSKP